VVGEGEGIRTLRRLRILQRMVVVVVVVVRRSRRQGVALRRRLLREGPRGNIGRFAWALLEGGGYSAASIYLPSVGHEIAVDTDSGNPIDLGVSVKPQAGDSPSAAFSVASSREEFRKHCRARRIVLSSSDSGYWLITRSDLLLLDVYITLIHYERTLYQAAVARMCRR
jgi:hypothetical protein